MTPVAWRFAVLGGLSGGLALSATASGSAKASPAPLLVAALIATAALILVPAPSGRGVAIRLGLVALAAGAAGLALGDMRLAAIDAGAFNGPVGREVMAHGFVTAVPHRADGEVSVRIQTAQGRLAVEGQEPVADLPIGTEVAARGTIQAPPPWEADYLARFGISEVLRAERIRPTTRRRGGAAGIIDRIRSRADAALERGTPDPEAALLRGFLLGEDDRIDPQTVDDFKRSGLAHLLAVSGDCVMLLALLGAWLLGFLGVNLRTRLFGLLALIAVYVPVAGAGPSIQRAGIMGAAGVVAALAGRPRWRWYAVLLAAALTLALNPRSVTDPSWQLSFAAVIGILLFARRIRDLILESPGPFRGEGRMPSDGPSPARRAFAEGAGVTVAATLTTAPLFAHHFGAVSLASLPANLLALPAIAPMMWLGMLAAILGQVPGVPIEPLTALAGLLAAYVAQVANWLATPGWAQVGIALPTWPAVGAAYVALGALITVALGSARRRRGAASPRRDARLALVAVAAAIVAWVAPGIGSSRGAGDHAFGLRIVVMDVGQGDAILLDPADGGPVLVDGGPPGDDLGSRLESEGVSNLAAAIVTHDQSDHVGGIDELLSEGFPIHRLVYSEPDAGVLRAAQAVHVRALQVAEGSDVRSGSLNLEVVWPPRSALDARAADPNQVAAVLLARWRSFSMLLTADAEAEAVPLDPGPVDILKVAHHGSTDAGLDALLDRTVPRLAVVSVGADNPYGHPTPETLATLAEHGIPTLRTDQAGDVAINVKAGGWSVERG
jgi:competence protein ComEC